jgi:hypothetical protein
VTTAEGHVTAARTDVATKQGEFDQAKRELDAAVNELVTKTVALAAPLPGGPPAAAAAAEANRKAELQAAKVVLVREQGEFAAAKTHLEVAQKGSPAVGAIAAVIGLEGRESDLRNAKAALETRKREIAEALSNRKPASLSVHGRQIRAFLTVMALVVLACDHFDVNYTYACVKVARRQPVNGWVSNGVDSPREVVNTVEIQNLPDAKIEGAIVLRRLPPVAPATIGKIEIRGRVVDQNGETITSDLIWEPNPR